MLKKPWSPQVEAFISRFAALPPDAVKWLSINLHAEFANGDLAQETPTPGAGKVDLLDAWVVGFIGNAPRFSILSDRPEEEQAAAKDRLSSFIRELPDGAPLEPDFSAGVFMTGCKTIAAYAIARTADGREVELLLRNPYAKFEEAVTCLKMTLRIAEKAAAPVSPPPAPTRGRA